MDKGGIRFGSGRFRELRAYRPGNPFPRIAWKASSPGPRVMTREFEATAGASAVLDWEALDHGGTEERLSRLCAMLLRADRLDIEFGLNLPGRMIGPGRGPAHRRQCCGLWPCFGCRKEARMAADARPMSVLPSAVLAVATVPTSCICRPGSRGGACFSGPGHCGATGKNLVPRAAGPGPCWLWAGMGAVALFFGHLPGATRAWAMLAVLLGLKPLKSALTGTGWSPFSCPIFLIIANLFFSQTWAWPVYRRRRAGGHHRAHPHQPPDRRPQAGPQTGGNHHAPGRAAYGRLFLIFPRIPGSLFYWPGQDAGRTVFQRHHVLPATSANWCRPAIRPFGSNLADRRPPTRTRYWRGLVLWDFDGRQWSRGELVDGERLRPRGPDAIRYTLTMEPTRQPG